MFCGTLLINTCVKTTLLHQKIFPEDLEDYNFHKTAYK